MPKDGYIWVIGDIHGYAASLAPILSKISEFPTEKVIFLGDYIDKGPEPKKVLDMVIGLDMNKITLMGDHELFLLNSIENKTIQPKLVLEWSNYGYETTLKDFDAPDVEILKKNIDKKYLDFFHSLSLFHTEIIEKGDKKLNLFFSHAGPFLDYPLDEQLKLKNFTDHNNYLKEKGLDFESSCLMNEDGFLQRNLSAWNNYLLIHGHIRTQYRQNRNRLRYSEKTSNSNFDFSDIPNPLYYPGTSIVAALDIDTGIDVGGKLTAVGFSPNNVDFNRGKLNLKIIQTDSSRRSKNIYAVVFDLTVCFTDEVSSFTRFFNKFFRKKK
jgi:serine/threonine protein phosphatase 1